MTDWAAETEAKFLDSTLRLAPESGWSWTTFRKAAGACGMTLPEAELLLPHGPRDLAALLAARRDAETAEVLLSVDPNTLKIRERIARAVETWIEATMAEPAAARRWAGFLSLPQNLSLGARLYWTTADRIWRWAGDTATDENHYSKRAILSGLLTSTLAVRLSADEAVAKEHLARGIQKVMDYEKFKARFKGKTWASDWAAKFGAMRYGAAKEAEPPPAA